MDILKPCPFCGSKNIALDGEVGTQLNVACIDCGIGTDLQKSDHMTLEERDTWCIHTYRHSDEVEIRVRQILIDIWNTRV